MVDLDASQTICGVFRPVSVYRISKPHTMLFIPRAVRNTNTSQKDLTFKTSNAAMQQDSRSCHTAPETLNDATKWPSERSKVSSNFDIICVDTMMGRLKDE